MRHTRSHNQGYMHFVWTTKRRERLLVPELERPVYRSIHQQAQNMGFPMLALGGMPDHVHLLIQMPSTYSIAQIVKQIKGASSSVANKSGMSREYFRWQEGYGMFSLTRTHVKRVIQYVERQKEHHEAGTLWPDLEYSGEETGYAIGSENLVTGDW